MPVFIFQIASKFGISEEDVIRFANKLDITYVNAGTGMVDSITGEYLEDKLQEHFAASEPRTGKLPAPQPTPLTPTLPRTSTPQSGTRPPDADCALTADEAELQERVSKLRKENIAILAGQAKPATAATTGQAYVRDPLVKAWVLQNANGKCEGCGNPAPFVGDDGEPFLESHHVLLLADGGSDTITNAVALSQLPPPLPSGC